MEKKTMGAFLSALRKANGMTQQEVADKLNVSNKTVSKWERDEGCPEIMMLPAIAELYSVTVDEILRGERIVKAESEQIKAEKSGERIRYLTERATVKFTDCAIASVVLGAVALLLAYIMGEIISYNYIWIGYVLVLLFTCSSVTVALIAFNNLTASLKGTGDENKKDYEEAMKKAIKYLTAVAFLFFVTLAGLLAGIRYGNLMLIVLPVASVAGAFLSLYIRSLIYKSYGIEDDSLTPTQRHYRNGKIRQTAIILAVILASSVLLPFVFGWVETSSHTIFSFPEAVGYQYETEEDAEREYYKLKDFITGKRVMYTVVSGDEPYCNENGKYELIVEQLGYSYKEKDNSYTNTGNKLYTSELLYFDSAEDAEKFKKENVLEEVYIAGQRNIMFYDGDLSVSYKSETDSFFNGILDIMPAFLITGAGISFAVLLVSAAVYYVNKKKII